ncbi:hypothetical protein M622_17690 [Thauera terpenica 58Eu]|uniref:Uncharacterized protein n=2 Tax=Thauera terpenica TaxID=76113 RepID=S9ZN02_9RHOO|nr:hypothetical protein M622_17690 [Thauera terpenica 58Eu]
MFGRAVRGEYPTRLPLESIIALASLTLDGAWAPQELAEIRKRVDSLLAAGLLQPGDDHLFGQEAVREVLPALALPEGAALVAWLGAKAPAKRRGSGAETKAVNRAATAQEVRGRDASTAAQPWAQEWQREWQPIMRVLGGAQSLGKLDELLKGTEFQFAPTDLIKALRKWDETGRWGAVPKKTDQVLASTLRRFVPSHTWLTGNRGSAEEKEQRISLLVECYQIGKEADNDEELGRLLESAGVGPLLRVA